MFAVFIIIGLYIYSFICLFIYIIIISLFVCPFPFLFLWHRIIIFASIIIIIVTSAKEFMFLSHWFVCSFVGFESDNKKLSPDFYEHFTRGVS